MIGVRLIPPRGKSVSLVLPCKPQKGEHVVLPDGREYVINTVTWYARGTPLNPECWAYLASPEG